MILNVSSIHVSLGGTCERASDFLCHHVGGQLTNIKQPDQPLQLSKICMEAIQELARFLARYTDPEVSKVKFSREQTKSMEKAQGNVGLTKVDVENLLYAFKMVYAQLKQQNSEDELNMAKQIRDQIINSGIIDAISGRAEATDWVEWVAGQHYGKLQDLIEITFRYAKEDKSALRQIFGIDPLGPDPELTLQRLQKVLDLGKADLTNLPDREYMVLRSALRDLWNCIKEIADYFADQISKNPGKKEVLDDATKVYHALKAIFPYDIYLTDKTTNLEEQLAKGGRLKF